MSEELKKVRMERTGWRDQGLDELLTDNGLSQPDSFLVTEYDQGKSVSIIEYKGIQDDYEPDRRLVNYCDLRRNQEHYFIVLYDYERRKGKYRITEFRIYPGNQSASTFLESEYSPNFPIILKEIDFIEFLYKIRGNLGSKYLEEAKKNYSEWFEVKQTFDLTKNIISARHRSYAYDVPAADIDSIICDSDLVPYLFVEYKANHNYGTRVEKGHNHFISMCMSQSDHTLNDAGKKKLYNVAIADLGNGCKDPLPVIAVEYNLENNVFSLYAMNDKAKSTVKLGNMSQKEYLTYIKDPNNFRARSRSKKICPFCKKELILKNGKFGKFYGCPNFKTTGCKYTLNADTTKE